MARTEVTISPDSIIRLWAGRHGITISWAKLLELIDHPSKKEPWRDYAMIEVGEK